VKCALPFSTSTLPVQSRLPRSIYACISPSFFSVFYSFPLSYVSLYFKASLLLHNAYFNVTVDRYAINECIDPLLSVEILEIFNVHAFLYVLMDILLLDL